jgi:hypothetical protein
MVSPKCHSSPQPPRRAFPIQGPTATLLYDDWYPALRTDTLRAKGKLAKAMLLEHPTWCWES